jgi:hypothetical protein
MSQRLVLGTALALTSAFACAQALVSERTISATAAQEAARVALETCRKEGHRVTVTVLDHAARTKVVLRDDGASPHSLQHSRARGGEFPAKRGRAEPRENRHRGGRGRRREVRAGRHRAHCRGARRVIPADRRTAS